MYQGFTGHHVPDGGRVKNIEKYVAGGGIKKHQVYPKSGELLSLRVTLSGLGLACAHKKGPHKAGLSCSLMF